MVSLSQMGSRKGSILITTGSLPKTVAFITVCLLLLASAQAQTVTGLFGTGVTASGGLASYRSPDLHYTLIYSVDPTVSVPRQAFVSDGSHYPFIAGGWAPNGPTSGWVSPIPDQDLGNSIGSYTYETTFNISSGDPHNVQISGLWAVDDFLTDVRINGHPTGVSNSLGHWELHPFSFPSQYFIAGINTLDFLVVNGDNGNGNTPTGLRVEFTSVPEPSSFSVLALAILCLTLRRAS